MTKRQLGEACSISWGTVVNTVNSLLEKRLIVCNGTETSGKQKLGKTAYTYALNSEYPLFIGIDVEYSTTTIVLVNQKNEIKEKIKLPFNQNHNISEFCEDVALQIETQLSELKQNVFGIGIGISRWLFPKEENLFQNLSGLFHKQTGLVTFCQDNVSSLTHLKQVEHYHGADFIALSVRDDIGLGISYNGEVVRRNLAWFSQIGHLKVNDNENRCICGRSGCLETEYNQRYFLSRYLAMKGKLFDYESMKRDNAEIARVLGSFFSEAQQGNETCLGIIDGYCDFIATLLVPLIVAFGIPNVLVTGNFGTDAIALEKGLARSIAYRMNSSKSDINVVYTPLLREGFARGAALLILDEYLHQ
ncbi:MAG: ROK family protein [Sphaerochaetaceae bacterium]